MRKRLMGLFSLVLMIFVLFSTVSCDRSYDEAEVTANASRLLKEAEVLNEIYYGKGIRYITTGYTDGYYYEADPMHLHQLGFSTVEELKNKTLATFTKGYSEQIFATKLSMIEDETGVQQMVRYYQKYEGINILAPVCIMVYSKAPVSLKDELIYDYASIRVTGSHGQTVIVEVDVTVKSGDKSQLITLTIDLIEEDDGWKIDNPCYANYNDNYGEY